MVNKIFYFMLNKLIDLLITINNQLFSIKYQFQIFFSDNKIIINYNTGLSFA